MKEPIKEEVEQIQSAFKNFIRAGGITEIILVVFESSYKLVYKPIFADYKIAATAKIATYESFDKMSYVESYKYLGMTVHFKIVK